MKEIELSNGGVALVDDQDYDDLAAYRWNRSPQGYAQRTGSIGGRKIKVLMHHVILPPEPGMSTDHRNLNKLDNRRCNLRPATRSQNLANTPPKAGHSSQYKGVSWRRRAGKWQANIKVHGRQYFLGYFADEQEAALAYNRAALRYFGEYAYLNVIEDQWTKIIPLFAEQAAVA